MSRSEMAHRRRAGLTPASLLTPPVSLGACPERRRAMLGMA